MLDGDPATAWQEGASGDGVGERIDLVLPPLEGVTGLNLRIRTGYQRSASLWRANGVPTGLRVTLVGAAGATRASQILPLKHQMGWQEVEIGRINTFHA